MASRTRTILGAVKSAVSGINGAGGYTHDLSASGAVVIGRPTSGSGPTPPCAWIAIGDLASTHGPQVGRYRRDLTIDIMAFVPTASDSTEDRQLAGADLLDDVCQALEASRTLTVDGTPQVLDLIVEAGSFDGAQAGMAGTAAVLARVAVYWHANSAAGV